MNLGEALVYLAKNPSAAVQRRTNHRDTIHVFDGLCRTEQFGQLYGKSLTNDDWEVVRNPVSWTKIKNGDKLSRIDGDLVTKLIFVGFHPANPSKFFTLLSGTDAIQIWNVEHNPNHFFEGHG